MNLVQQQDAAIERIIQQLTLSVPALLTSKRKVWVRVPAFACRSVERWFEARRFTVGSSAPEPDAKFIDVLAEKPR